MRKWTVYLFPLFLILFTLALSPNSEAQNRTVIDLPCGTNCTSLKVQVPHLKTTEDYKVISVPYTPYPYVTSAPALVYTQCISGQDDKFFDTSFLPFKFCFYGASYSKMVISTNGFVTFDTTNALRGSHWALSSSSTIPGAGPGSPTTAGLTCPTPSTVVLLPRAAIFGIYQDIDITRPSANKKMEYRVEGTAPNRRIIVSFFEIPHYVNTSCTGLQTSQIVMYENTGTIDVFVGNKTICASHNDGIGILGIQNWNRDKAVAAPGKNATQFAESSTGYSFIPSGTNSRFDRSELWDVNGNLLATSTASDTSTTVAGLLDIKFGNICPAATSTNYVIKTYFAGCATGEPIERIDSITVNKTTGLNATSSATPSACGPNGSLTINIPSGIGTAPFHATLNGGAPQTLAGLTHTFTGLVGGAYTVVITDNSGCSQTISATVPTSGTLSVTSTSTPSSCAGASDGSLTITPQNGTAPFQFSLNGGAFQTSGTFPNIAPGTYFITIKDASGCVRNNYQASVTQGPAMTAPYTVLPPSCSGAGNGSITLTPSGTPPFTYSVNGGAYQSGTVITGLNTGTYFIGIRDSKGCRIDNMQVAVPASTSFQANMTAAAPSCSGMSNGTITITPLAGSGPYQYSVNGGAFQTGLTITGLATGTYSVVARDASGCTSQAYSVTVPQGVPLTTTLTTTPTSCSGAANGTITVMPPTMAAIVYQYSRDGGPFQNSNVFTGLATGTYMVVVRDPSGCMTAPIPAVVQPGQPLPVAFTLAQVTCNGGNNGQATVQAPSNGTAPFQYSINNGPYQSSNVFGNLQPGNYTVSIRDNNACVGQGGFTITQPSAITASVTKQSVVCKGQSNGKITVAASGGVAPYQYSIGGVNYQASNEFGVAAGTYTVYVKDASGCIRQLPPETVTEPEALTATFSTADANCTTNGQATLTASGGTAPYEYSSGTGFQSSNVFSLAQGNYTLSARDANGCVFNTPATVALQSQLYLTPAPDTVICEGLSVQLQATSNGSSYSWEQAAGLNSYSSASTIASPVVSTNYIVKAMLGTCSLNDTILVRVNPAPVADAGDDTEICYGQNTVLQGSGGTAYEWSGGSQNFQVSSPLVTPAVTTQYSLNVTDALGCRSLQPSTVTITVTPPITVMVSRDTIVAEGDRFQLHSSSIGTNYLWTPAVGLSSATDPHPFVTVTNDITYTVVASTGAGCRGEASVTLKVYKGPELYVPSGFTPNNDGRNDKFFPFPVGVTKLNYFKVYNRWGQMIFSTTVLHEGWDGMINGKPQPAGTYVWMAEGVTKDNKVITKQGVVTLLR
jgi:gliding motility-associated-like protein